MLVSITGLIVSGVFFPSTTAVFFISPFSFTTSTVNDTVIGFSDVISGITQEILSSTSIPLWDILFSTKVVPSGIISDIFTFLATTSVFVLATVISYVILLPFCIALSFSFIEFNFATLLISKFGPLVTISDDI